VKVLISGDLEFTIRRTCLTVAACGGAQGNHLDRRSARSPDEFYQAPKSWTERAYPKLIHYNKVEKGGYFAAWEQPQLFADEIRAAFRSLRKLA
jgi:pimeloyl-ACP methyl ester carboxylesterase